MAKITDDSIQTLRDLPIRDVAERLGIEFARGRENGNAHCFNTNAHKHGDRDASLGFIDRVNRFNCLGCGVHGGTIDLVMQVKGVDFKEACEWLASTYGISLGRQTTTKQAKPSNEPNFDKKSPYADYGEPSRINDWCEYDRDKLPFADVYQAYYDNCDEPNEQLRAWWAKRGFSPALLKQYGWRSVTPQTVAKTLRQYDEAILLKAGLVSENKGQLEHIYKGYDVAVPFYVGTLENLVGDFAPEVGYIRFRNLQTATTKDGRKLPKYLPPKVPQEVEKRPRPIIYGFDRLFKWCAVYPERPQIFVTESETDSIAITELARRKGKEVYAVALAGGQKSEHSLDLREFAQMLQGADTARNITVNIVTDRDETGEHFYKTVATSLYKAGFDPNKLYKWQEWHESLKDVGEHLQKLAEQPNG